MPKTDVYDECFYSTQIEGSVQSASVVAKIVYELIRPTSVIDVGCGLGAWLAAFSGLGVGNILGLDSHNVSASKLKIPFEFFHRCNFELPLRVNEKFDLAISLEVAEHLPEARAFSFVEDLTACADIVLFSAAIPYQGGIQHKNEQWPSYWAAMFNKHGFRSIDAVRPKIWADNRVKWWYAQNMLLYASDKVLSRHKKLSVVAERRKGAPLDIVHPRRYLLEADPENLSMRRILKGLKCSFRRNFMHNTTGR